MVFNDLVSVDYGSDAYADFTMFAWDALLDDATPMADEAFWPLIESVGWPEGEDDIATMSRRLAKRVSLTDAVRLSLTALDWTGQLEFLWDTDIDVSGEDSQEDFLYHLVGLGQSFVQPLKTSPDLAIAIANDDSYIESFKYVLDGCRTYFPLTEYVDAFVASKRFARSTSQPILDTMRKVDDKTPGIVTRVDAASYEIITPVQTNTISYP